METTGLDARVRMVRRSGAEAGISLRQRRAWFADDPPKPDPATPNPAQDAGTDDVEDVSKLPAWAQRIIKDTREEAKDRRLALKKLEDSKAAEETARLVEEGKWKTLAEKHAAEVEKLRPTAERLTLLEQKMQATNGVRVKRIPEAMRSVIPTDYDPVKLSEWLDKNEGLLTTPQAPNFDAGQRGTGQPMTKLTDSQLAAAAKAGLTPERYLKALQDRQG